jgi:hypothetical protein
MDTKTLTNIALERCDRDGVAVFDPLFVDNCIMTSALVARFFPLDRGEDRRAWIHDGVHVFAARSAAQAGAVKYEFTAPSWKMLYTGRFDRAGKLNARRSRITWVADHGVQRGDKGQTARVELNQWLAAALAADDDLPA